MFQLASKSLRLSCSGVFIMGESLLPDTKLPAQTTLQQQLNKLVVSCILLLTYVFHCVDHSSLDL